MTVIRVEICDNCHLRVPQACDGRVFWFEMHGRRRRVCRGADGADFLPDGKLRVVMGHGCSYEVQLTEETHA